MKKIIKKFKIKMRIFNNYKLKMKKIIKKLKIKMRIFNN